MKRKKIASGGLCAPITPQYELHHEIAKPLWIAPGVEMWQFDSTPELSQEEVYKLQGVLKIKVRVP